MVDHVLNDVILPVVPLPVFVLCPIDIPGVAPIGHHDDEVVVQAGVKRRAVRPPPGRVVLRHAVQQIQHGIPLAGRLVVARQKDVVPHRPLDGYDQGGGGSGQRGVG